MLARETLAPPTPEIALQLGRDCYGGTPTPSRGWSAPSCSIGGSPWRSRVVTAGCSVTGSPTSRGRRLLEQGVIVYSNRAKQALLGVPESVLRATVP